MSARRLAAALCAALALGGCAVPSLSTPLPSFPPSTQRETAPVAPSPVTSSLPAALRVVDYTNPPRVTGTWPPACSVRGPLPDPRCTPGSIGNRARDQVCRDGFSATMRPSSSSTERAKTAAMRSYRIPLTKRMTTELDHLVPLGIGGSNDASNLWPEVSDLAGAGFRNGKDATEARVLAAACPAKGPPRVTLEAAQRAMAANWTTALARLGIL